MLWSRKNYIRRIYNKYKYFYDRNRFNDFENSKDSKPQIILKIRDLKSSIIIVEIDSFDDEEMPLDATDRIALYTAKLSQKYNVLGQIIECIGRNINDPKKRYILKR